MTAFVRNADIRKCRVTLFIVFLTNSAKFRATESEICTVIVFLGDLRVGVLQQCAGEMG